MTLARRRRQPRGIAEALALAAVLAAALAVLARAAIVAQERSPLASYYRINAAFRDLSNLRATNEIRVAGRRVGQVLHPRLVGRTPVVTLQLPAHEGPLRSDTTVRIRSKGLLGQRFLELRPGRHGAPLRQGATLPVSRSSATVQLPEVLGAFDAPRRRSLRAIIDDAGIGMLGRGADLNRATAQAPRFAATSRSLATAVLRREGAARRFFPSLESAAAAADAARRDIARGFAPAARALRPVGAQRAAVRRTLEVAPHALATARVELRPTDELLDQVRAFAQATTALLADGPAALRATRRFVADAPRQLPRADAVLRRLRGAIPAVTRLSGALTPVLPRLRAALRDNIPPLRELSGRACDVLGFAGNWRSMLEWGAPGGGDVGPLNVLRLELLASPESIGGLADPAAARAVANPYPAPCQAGTEKLP